MIGRRGTWLAAGTLALAAVGPAFGADDPAAVEFFEKAVRPVLAAKCQSCHGPDKQKGGLRLDSRAGAIAGGDSGPAVVPGKPGESPLVEAINYGEVAQMPPKSRLPASEVAALTRWVSLGAPWPDSAATGSAARGIDPAEWRRRASHWSLQPVRAVAPPVVRKGSWPINDVDRFVLAGLEAKGLSPAPDADRRAWLRRATFDLIGLPPAPAESDAFLADKSDDAHLRVVDRLLASPHYGERWGRHWLDLMRFAETAGHEFDYDILDAWRYRDYVVRAFNADVPYDRFVVEHLAGDLLASPRRDPATGADESVLGTGFYLLGEGTHSPVDLREEEAARVDNQVDVVGKAFLGLTLACARCHDHKFDPILAKDYYALAGYLKSSRHGRAFVDPPGLIAAKIDELKAIKAEVAATLPKRESGPTFTDDGSTVFEDFSGPSFDGWSVAGDAFGAGPTRVGDFLLRAEAPAVAIPVPPGRAHSGLVSGRLQGVLRSKTFIIEHPFIHAFAGGRKGRINLVVDGFEKIRSPIYGGLTLAVDAPEAPRWWSMDVTLWTGHRAYIELADGGVVDFTTGHTHYTDGSGDLSVDEIRFSDRAKPPALLVAKPEPTPVPLDAPAMASRIARYREVEATIGPPSLAPAILDGTGEDARVSVRGNPRTLGEVAPRRFLTVLSTPDESVSGPPPVGSGRLDLARRVVDPANPLTARVLVNRLWAHHFGEGIVRTPDDFGAMGQAPSHPDLLDWLAADFVRGGWSIKRMHRLMVLSRAYRMSSAPRPVADRDDPSNRLLHRRTVRRLDAESLRDAILAVSGRLDRTTGGSSVKTHLTPFMEGRGRPPASGPLDGSGRRTLYLDVRRNFLSPLLLAFDFPGPSTCIGRRNVSNVPAQALTLLNDPFVIAQANLWADRVRSESSSSPARLDSLYRTAFGRLPTDRERSEALAFVASMTEAHDEARAWGDLCHVLLNAKEFVFVE